MKFIFLAFKALRRLGKIFHLNILANLSHYLCIKVIKYKISGVKLSDYNISAPSSYIPKIIWVYWHQGYENLPHVVEKCRSQLIKNLPEGFEIVFIDKNNLDTYFIPPSFISEKLKSGAITLTHFSDILRFYLLYMYGGYWFDSTLLVSESLSDLLNERKFFTLKHTKFSVFHSPTKGAWTSYCIGTYKQCSLSKFMYDSFVYYWSKNESLIDYHLVDYLLALSYRDIPEIRNVIDSQTDFVGDNRWLIQDNYDVIINTKINEAIEQDKYKIYKLSYKLQPPASHDTYYYKFFK